MHKDQIHQTDFSRILMRMLSRRTFLIAGGALSSMTLGIGSMGLTANSSESSEPKTFLDFNPVPTNTLDTVTIPPGYNWHVVASWGDPLWSNGKPFDPKTRGSAMSQEMAFGDNNDGMELFSIEGRTILAVNNEYTNLPIMYGNRTTKRPETRDDVHKGQAAIGVTIMEISEVNGRWSIVMDSPFNRRISAKTLTTLAGPAAGNKLVQTAFDPTGANPVGTFNNCGSGKTPWNTYLSCEENFNSFFASSRPGYIPTAQMKRYGLTPEDRGFAWYKADQRFDLSLHPNEANRFGYILEIDPLNPDTPPKNFLPSGDSNTKMLL